MFDLLSQIKDDAGGDIEMGTAAGPQQQRGSIAGNAAGDNAAATAASAAAAAAAAAAGNASKNRRGSQRSKRGSTASAGSAAGGLASPGAEAIVSAAAPPPTAFGHQDKQLDSFFADVKGVQSLLADIGKLHDSVDATHERSKTATRTEDVRAAKAAMQSDINEVQKAAHVVKARLEALDKANARAAQQQGCGPSSSSARTRAAVTAALRKRLKDRMEAFAGLREKLAAEYREVVERRLYTVTGVVADEDQVDALIESGEADAIFQRAMLEQGRGHVLDTLAEIKERHESVVALEKSLMDLHQLFLDMAVLVEAQGGLLDNIEAQVQKSVDYIQQGTKSLQQAKTYQRSNRKRLCCLLVLFLVVALVIALGVGLPMAKKGSGRAPASPAPAAPVRRLMMI